MSSESRRGSETEETLRLLAKKELVEGPAEILQRAASVYAGRNLVYGDNYKNRVGPIMAILFPEGVKLTTPEEQTRYHLLMLKVVKLTRYAENWKCGGHEDSLIDDAVYSAMLAEVDRG